MSDPNQPPRDPSQNARTHGCTSKMRFLPGETPAEYDKLWNAWLERFHPINASEFELVTHVVDSAWRMRRSQRVFEEFEYKLLSEKPDASAWTEEQMRRLQLLQRYKTADTNAFHKAVRLIEFTQKVDGETARHIERTAERCFQEATTRTPEQKNYKRQIGRLIGTPPALPKTRNDGGCTCTPCTWEWGMLNLPKPTLPTNHEQIQRPA